ncbi:hypothetical protein VP01_749g4, partial [Puccinia sorghi]
KKQGIWKFSVSDHNHPPSSNPAAHFINRNLYNKTQEEKTFPEKNLLATVSTIYTAKNKSALSNQASWRLSVLSTLQKINPPSPTKQLSVPFFISTKCWECPGKSQRGLQDHNIIPPLCPSPQPVLGEDDGSGVLVNECSCLFQRVYTPGTCCQGA